VKSRLKSWHKSTLTVPGNMSMLSGSTCNCNVTKPYLTIWMSLSLTLPGGYLNLAKPGNHLFLAPIPDTCCQIIDFKSYQNLEKYTLGPLNLTCAIKSFLTTTKTDNRNVENNNNNSCFYGMVNLDQTDSYVVELHFFQILQITSFDRSLSPKNVRSKQSDALFCKKNRNSINNKHWRNFNSLISIYLMHNLYVVKN